MNAQTQKTEKPTPADRISEIATLATRNSKPNKKEVFSILTDVIESGERPTPAQLANLYAFFIPRSAAKPKNPEDWVSRAMAENDVRGYLNYVYSDGENLVASNGHRLHLTPTNRPQGYYDAALNPVEDQGSYPDYSRVIPDKKLTKVTPPDPATIKAKPSPWGPKGSLAVEVAPQTWVFKKYWEQATAGKGIKAMRLSGKGAVGLWFDGGAVAVVMPIRMD